MTLNKVFNIVSLIFALLLGGTLLLKKYWDEPPFIATMDILTPEQTYVFSNQTNGRYDISIHFDKSPNCSMDVSNECRLFFDALAVKWRLGSGDMVEVEGEISGIDRVGVSQIGGTQTMYVNLHSLQGERELLQNLALEYSGAKSGLQYLNPRLVVSTAGTTNVERVLYLAILFGAVAIFGFATLVFMCLVIASRRRNPG